MKVACTVLRGGKLERAYLSQLGRGMYYGSYRLPRTLVWAIGTIILIAMMATGFLGYVYSPKWFNINISYAILSFLIIVYYTIHILVRKSKVLMYSIGKINNIKYNKLNNKSIYLLNNMSFSSEAIRASEEFSPRMSFQGGGGDYVYPLIRNFLRARSQLSE